MIKLDKCAGSCNILNNLSDRVYVSNKTEDLNLMFLIYLQEKMKV